MASRVGLGARWSVLIAVAGIVALASCGGVAEREAPADSEASKGGEVGTIVGTGGSNGAMPTKPVGTTPVPSAPPTNRAGSSQGGAPSVPDPDHGLGGCIQVLTSGGDGPEPCPTPASCRDITSAVACEAAGCVTTSGRVSQLVGGAGGSPDECQLIDDVFISCEDGYGGATAESGCDAACDRCISGGWTVGRYGKWTRDDCVWECVNGRIESPD